MGIILILEFPQPVAVDEVSYTVGRLRPDRNPRRFKVEGSHDGLAWHTIIDHTKTDVHQLSWFIDGTRDIDGTWRSVRYRTFTGDWRSAWAGLFVESGGTRKITDFVAEGDSWS